MSSDLKKQLIDKEEETPQPRDPVPEKAGEQNNESQQNPATQQEEDEENYEPAPIVIKLKENIQNWEYKLNDGSGIFFGIVCIIAFSLMRFIRESAMPENTIIEIAFISFLTAFLINYYLVRVGNILPYIDNEDKNFTAKLAGFSALFSMVFLLYSFQHAEVNSCIFIFVLTWIVSLITEKIYFGSRINPQDLGILLLLTFSAYLVLTPKFLLDYNHKTQGQTEIGEQLTAEQILSESEEYTNQQQKGLISALLASLCFSYMTFNIKKLSDRDFMTLTHIICLIVVLFLPVFFPIEGLHSPSLVQWVIMIGFGIIFTLLIQIFVRSVQIESPSKIVGLLPVFLGFSVVLDIFLGVQPSLLQLVGSVIAIVAGFYILKLGYTSHSTQLPNSLGNSKEQKLSGSNIKGDFVELKNLN